MLLLVRHDHLILPADPDSWRGHKQVLFQRCTAAEDRRWFDFGMQREFVVVVCPVCPFSAFSPSRKVSYIIGIKLDYLSQFSGDETDSLSQKEFGVILSYFLWLNLCCVLLCIQRCSVEKVYETQVFILKTLKLRLSILQSY